MIRVPFVHRLVIALIAVAAAMAAWYAFPLDGVAHGGTVRLLGRFHPVVVHFPIVLLLLMPALEWFGRKHGALREAAGFILGLALLAAVVALFAGMALARADGHEGTLLTDHLRGGFCVVIGTALAWCFRGVSRAAYFSLLVLTLGTLGWAAHNGGSLTHGETYLTESLPVQVKRWFGIKDAPAPETYAPGTVFAAAILPTLQKYCIDCHGPEKQKGDYRMDGFAALLAGGKSGKRAITPHDLSQSEFVRRLMLDRDDDKVMPPRKKPRLKPAEISLLRWWIRQGAERDLLLTAVKDAPAEVATLLAARAESGAAQPAYVPKVADYSQMHGEIARIEQSTGIKFVPVSQRPGDGLILRVRGAESRFGDAELAQLARIAPYVVEAELAGTNVTDAGFTALKPFINLEKLHLERTRVTGAALGELRGLSKLVYLNVCATRVSDEYLAQIPSLTALRQLYLFGSHATEGAVNRLRTALPQCEIGSVSIAPDKVTG